MLKLTLAVPERPLVRDAAVEWVIAPAARGEVQILPGHAEYTATLGVGEVRYAQGGTVKRAAVAGGFLEVKKDGVVILADEAVAGGDGLSAAQAHGALARAEAALREARTPEDVEAALAAQKKAAAWLSAAKE